MSITSGYVDHIYVIHISNVLKANDCGAKNKCHRLYNGGGRSLSIDLGQKVFEFLEEDRSETITHTFNLDRNIVLI